VHARSDGCIISAKSIDCVPRAPGRRKFSAHSPVIPRYGRRSPYACCARLDVVAPLGTPTSASQRHRPTPLTPTLRKQLHRLYMLGASGSRRLLASQRQDRGARVREASSASASGRASWHTSCTARRQRSGGFPKPRGLIKRQELRDSSCIQRSNRNARSQ
jgi:hypothetical protein